MPVATVSTETHHHDLKTLPGGFVELRQLSYHEMLVRRDKGMIASMEQQGGKRSKNQDTKMILESLQTWERQYTFENCIEDHNLEDENGKKLNFKDPKTLTILNPKIAFEIERLIDDLNGGDDTDEDFTTLVSNSSLDETTYPNDTE